MAPHQILRDTVYMKPITMISTSEEMEYVASLEKESYKEDEAASMETLLHCKKSAPAAFMVAMKLEEKMPTSPPDFVAMVQRPATLIGYLCGSLTAAGRLTQESMHTHDPQGEVYCIHSVCVDPAYRRMGLAKWMLDMHGRLWLPNLLPHVRTRSLICKAEQIGLFMGAGFELVGPSEIKRGKCQWYEMRQAL